MGNKSAAWLQSPSRLRGGECFKAGDKISLARKREAWLRNPCRHEGPKPFQARDISGNRPVGGQIGYITLTVRGVANASEFSKRSMVSHKWPDWLCGRCRIRGPLTLQSKEEMSTGPQVGFPNASQRGTKSARSTSGKLSSITPGVLGVPRASHRGGNQHWPTSWRSHRRYLGVANAAKTNSAVGRGGQLGYITPAVLRAANASKQGTKLVVPQKSATWLQNPDRLEGPECFGTGNKIGSGPEVANLVT